MTQSVSRFHPRLARYILQPGDNTLIRLAGPRLSPWEEPTEVCDISMSGLSFTAPGDVSPAEGELIKIQFEVPGEQQVACFAVVTRLEPFMDSRRKDLYLIAVQFQKLTPAHRVLLFKGLSRKIKSQHKLKEKQTRYEIYKAFAQHYKWKIALIFGLLCLGFLTSFLSFRYF